MRSLLQVSLALLLLTGCWQEKYPGYSETKAAGIYYKVLQFDEEGKSPNHGDMLRFKMQMDGDSLSSWHFQKVQVIRCDSTVQGLKSQLGIFHEGDSLSLLLEPEAYATEFGGKGLKAKSKKLTMVVLDVIPEKTWLAKKQLDRDIKAERQLSAMDEYLLSRIDSSAFAWKGGMLWRDMVKGDSANFHSGEELLLFYSAYLLDGTLIDQRTSDDEALFYQIGMQGQIIEGLRRAVAIMHRKDQVELIIPSGLAFGEDGAAGGIVPPWAPVRFELKVKATSELLP